MTFRGSNAQSEIEREIKERLAEDSHPGLTVIASLVVLLLVGPVFIIYASWKDGQFSECMSVENHDYTDCQ